MAKEEIIVIGTVLETSSNGLFKVEVDGQHQVLAVPAGRLRLTNYRIVPGDTVKVALSPYDLKRGRIVWRVTEGRKSR